MKKLNILAAVIMLLGLFYLSLGAMGLVVVAANAGIASAADGSSIPSLAPIVPMMEFLILLGCLTAACAVGLLLRKPFARKLWLGLSTFLLAFHLLWFVSDIGRRGVTAADVAELLPILLLVLFSWKLLRSKCIVQLFLDQNQGAPNERFDEEMMNEQNPSRRGPITLLVLGVLMFLGPVWGLLGTVVGMVRTFGELSQSGDADAEALASNIDLSLWTTMIGIAVSPIGLVLLVVGIIWIIKVNRRQCEASNQTLEASVAGAPQPQG